MKDVIFYVIGSIVTFCAIYPAWFAYWQREFPDTARRDYKRDLVFGLSVALILSIGSWLGLMIWFCFSVVCVFFDGSPYKYGFKWR